MKELFAAKVRKLAGKLQENEFTNILHFSEGVENAVRRNLQIIYTNIVKPLFLRAFSAFSSNAKNVRRGWKAVSSLSRRPGRQLSAYWYGQRSCRPSEVGHNQGYDRCR